jgi:hypothetical protein
MVNARGRYKFYAHSSDFFLFLARFDTSRIPLNIEEDRELTNPARFNSAVSYVYSMRYMIVARLTHRKGAFVYYWCEIATQPRLQSAPLPRFICV